MTKQVLILGASGKTGSHAERAFRAAGWSVRRFNREHDDMEQAAMGCDVILNAMNPPNYHNWAEIIPEITKQVIRAARASGAMVVIPGNVYVYGDTPGTWSQDTPHNPCAAKGRVRFEMEQSYRDSGVQVAILRAGNFIDPDKGDDVMSLMVLNAIRRGKVTFAGPGDVVQPWAYLPDWARAAVMLADKRAELGRFEDVPFPGHAVSLNDLKAGVEAELGRPLRKGHFPWWAMRLASPIWELARELSEMRYLWNTPHQVAADRFDALLPDFQATPLREVIRASLPVDVLEPKGKAALA